MDLGRPQSVRHNSLPARTCPFLWLTLLWKWSKVHVAEERLVGSPWAAMAESRRVGCRRESCSAGCAGTRGTLLLCLLHGSRVWCDASALGKCKFSWFFFVHVSPQCAIIFVKWCLTEAAAPHKRSDADLSRRSRTSWFFSHTYAATSAALHSASHGYSCCLPCQGVSCLGPGLGLLWCLYSP